MTTKEEQMSFLESHVPTFTKEKQIEVAKLIEPRELIKATNRGLVILLDSLSDQVISSMYKLALKYYQLQLNKFATE